MKIHVKQDTSTPDRKGRYPRAYAYYDHKGSVSKYQPHIGAKEQAKAAARAA